MTEQEDTFIGRGWSFPPSFSKYTKGVEMVSGNEDIEQSLHILFTTSRGERIMLEDYGCDLREFVFGNINTTYITRLKSRLANAILNYEPRIAVNSIDIDDSRSLEGLLLVNISYSIRQTNNRHNIVYPFYFLEGTNIGK